MKKVLMIAIAAVMFATPAFAAIENSLHDFSADGYGTTEICVFCHTPHNAQAIVNAPLWNHENSTANYTPYSSTTLTATVGQPTSISKLCLSCHDATVAIDSFGTNAGTAANFVTGAPALGTNLADDHPVGFAYDAALVSADGGLNDPTSAAIAPLLFANNLECASCHDVHNGIPTNAAMLRIDNTTSGLCLTCHNK